MYFSALSLIPFSIPSFTSASLLGVVVKTGPNYASNESSPAGQAQGTPPMLASCDLLAVRVASSLKRVQFIFEEIRA